MRERIDRRGSDAEEPARLLARVPQRLGQHERGSLSGRELRERLLRDVAILDVSEDVILRIVPDRALEPSGGAPVLASGRGSSPCDADR